MTLKQTIQKIASACEATQTRLVAVSKYATLDQIQEAFAAGVRDFGENKVQSLEHRQRDLPPEVASQIRWHFLGHLQSNKINKLLSCSPFLIQSIHSLEVAQALSQRCEAQQKKQAVLIQVNITQEPQKNGFWEADLHDAMPKLLALHGLEVRGLMALGPHPATPEQSDSCFGHLHALRDMLQAEFHIPLPELSMGMSEDFMLAMKRGATIIRVGHLIFNQASGSPSAEVAANQ